MERRRMARLTLMYKVVHGHVAIDQGEYRPAPPCPASTRTRSCHPLRLSLYAPNTNVFKFSFFPRTIIAWNSLPGTAIEDETAGDFKATLYE